MTGEVKECFILVELDECLGSHAAAGNGGGGAKFFFECRGAVEEGEAPTAVGKSVGRGGGDSNSGGRIG